MSDDKITRAELMRLGWSSEEATWIVERKRGLTYAQARLRANSRELWRVVKEAVRR